MSNDYLNIEKCPKCTKEHRYMLQVKRALIIKMFTMSDMSERPRTVRLTRLFTCPVTKEDFQATFTLTDTSSSRIEDVSVGGIANDDEQE